MTRDERLESYLTTGNLRWRYMHCVTTHAVADVCAAHGMDREAFLAALVAELAVKADALESALKRALETQQPSFLVVPSAPVDDV